MPRQLRIDYPGAIHHVMSRGDRRENIYVDNVDRQDFLKTLAEACQKTDWQVHACCLMRHHFHLVVETPQANLVARMGSWLSTYTIRLNHRHKLFGQRSGFCGRNCGAWAGIQGGHGRNTRVAGNCGDQEAAGRWGVGNCIRSCGE